MPEATGYLLCLLGAELSYFGQKIFPGYTRRLHKNTPIHKSRVLCHLSSDHTAYGPPDAWKSLIPGPGTMDVADSSLQVP